MIMISLKHYDYKDDNIWVYEKWNWPLLSISLPCLTKRACACLCLLHKCSWWAAWLLLPWAAAAPAPSPSCLPRREKASPFTAQIEKVRRRNAVVSAISASSDRSWPRLPSCGLATCTLDLARWTIKVWVAAETSLKAPTTSPSTSPIDASLQFFSVIRCFRISNNSPSTTLTHF